MLLAWEKSITGENPDYVSIIEAILHRDIIDYSLIFSVESAKLNCDSL